MDVPRSRRRALPLAAAALLAVAAAPTVAQAQTDLALTPQGPLTEDLAATVVASGHAAVTPDLVPPRIVVQARAATGEGCAPAPVPGAAAELGNVLVGFGPFRVGLALLPTDSGTVQACGWLVGAGGVVRAAAERDLVVRAPQHALRVQVPARVPAGGHADVEVTGTLGAKRRVLVGVARGARSCGVTYGDLPAGRSLGRTAYRRAGDVALAYRTPMLKKGTWTICTYVQEALREHAAELVIGRTLRSGPSA